jgi:hypothetical protein
LELLKSFLKTCKESGGACTCIYKHLPVLLAFIFDTEFEEILNLSDKHIKSLYWELVILKTYLLEVRNSAKWVKHSQSVHLQVTSVGFVHEEDGFEHGVLLGRTLSSCLWEFQNSSNQVK